MEATRQGWTVGFGAELQQRSATKLPPGFGEAWSFGRFVVCVDSSMPDGMTLLVNVLEDPGRDRTAEAKSEVADFVFLVEDDPVTAANVVVEWLRNT